MICCLGVLSASCGSASDNRSPHELLALSVSGLSSVDRYTFTGETGIGMGAGGEGIATTFQGTVENHDDVQLRASDAGVLAQGLHPLKLLSQVESTALKTELEADKSGGRTAVLRITADPKQAANMWANKLRGEFDRLENTTPGQLNVKLQSKQAVKAETQGSSSLDKAWRQELAKSKEELNAMLSTLTVQTTYRLVIDRKKLLPLAMEEYTLLHFTSRGQRAEESHRTKLSFKRTDGGNL